MATYIVTGGAGFIGSHLTDALIAQGHTVKVIDNLLLGKKEFIHGSAEFFECDIRNYDEIRPLFDGVDGVFHLAADPRLPISIEDPRETHDVNVTGTLNIAVAAKEVGAKVVFSSTCAVYADCELPIPETALTESKSPYGLHKLIGEQYFRLFYDLYGLKSVCLRYFNVFGPRKLAEGGYPMVIPIFLKQKAEGKKITVVGDGEQTRDYVYVSDVVQANVQAMNADIQDGRAFNIGSGNQVSVNEIAQRIGGEIERLPERKGEMRYIQADISKAKKELGWIPEVSFDEGMELLMNDAS